MIEGTRAVQSLRRKSWPQMDKCADVSAVERASAMRARSARDSCSCISTSESCDFIFVFVLRVKNGKCGLSLASISCVLVRLRLSARATLRFAEGDSPSL